MLNEQNKTGLMQELEQMVEDRLLYCSAVKETEAELEYQDDGSSAYQLAKIECDLLELQLRLNIEMWCLSAPSTAQAKETVDAAILQMARQTSNIWPYITGS